MDRSRLITTGVGRRGLGWLPDLPDTRDYTTASEPVKALLQQTAVPKIDATEMAKPVDLRAWCGPVEDQGEIGSCTANAAAGMVEYYVKKAKGEDFNLSRRFVYKATRNYLGWTGDTGAYLRSTIGALALFGAPPERFCPYEPELYDEEPSAFCYTLGQNFQAISYYRLDPPGTSAQAVLDAVKRHLSSEMPSMFGFTVYSSISKAAATGDIPFPSGTESVVGGHAVMAVGYDDNYEIPIPGANGDRTTGALLIRNSWGERWGDGGYGRLPYEYVLRGLAQDWWVLLDAEWIQTGVFDA